MEEELPGRRCLSGMASYVACRAGLRAARLQPTHLYGYTEHSQGRSLHVCMCACVCVKLRGEFTSRGTFVPRYNVPRLHARTPPPFSRNPSGGAGPHLTRDGGSGGPPARSAAQRRRPLPVGRRAAWLPASPRSRGRGTRRARGSGRAGGRRCPFPAPSCSGAEMVTFPSGPQSGTLVMSASLRFGAGPRRGGGRSSLPLRGERHLSAPTAALGLPRRETGRVNMPPSCAIQPLPESTLRR